MYNLKVNSDQNQDDSATRRAANAKPSGSPRTDKDFQKILSNKDGRQGEGNRDSKNAKFTTGLDGTVDFEEIADAEENLKQQQQPSLFDLSKGMIKKNPGEETSDVVKMASSDELAMESPTSIFKSLALKEKAAQAKSSQGKLERTSGKMEDFEDSEVKRPTNFSQESVDLTYINPLAINVKPTIEMDNKSFETVTPSQKMTTQQIVDAIVKAITTVETQGKTDTVVTLKQPPIFAGSNIVLTSYESAKGEFNIRFENLTQQAKSFMDMQQNQDSLRFALQQKGYAVHILVATTQVETPQIVANAQQPSRDENQEQQQQGRKKKNNEEEA